MNGLDWFLVIAFTVTNLFWALWFTSYRQGVMEAMDEHRKKYHSALQGEKH